MLLFFSRSHITFPVCHANTFAFKTYIEKFSGKNCTFFVIMHQEIFVDHLHVPHTDLGADNIVVS